MEARIKRRPGAAAYLGMSEQTFGRKSRSDPTFPKPIDVSEGITGYDVRDLDRWLDARPRLAPGARGLRGERKHEPEAA